MNKQTASKSAAKKAAAKTTAKPAAKSAAKPAAKSTPAKSVAAKPEPVAKPERVAKLTNEQKRKLAWIVLEAAAVLAESWDDVRSDYDCDDVDAALVAPILSQWLQYLPHDAWPTNFPEPTSKYVRGDA